jgi:hypothetical protein
MGRSLRRVSSIENLRSVDTAQEHQTSQPSSLNQSARSSDIELTNMETTDRHSHHTHTYRLDQSLLSHSMRPGSEVLEEEDVDERKPPTNMTTSSRLSDIHNNTQETLVSRNCYKRAVLKEIWLTLLLVILPMLAIPILFAVLVAKCKVKSEKGLFFEPTGSSHFRQRAYVLLNIPASK